MISCNSDYCRSCGGPLVPELLLAELPQTLHQEILRVQAQHRPAHPSDLPPAGPAGAPPRPPTGVREPRPPGRSHKTELTDGGRCWSPVHLPSPGAQGPTTEGAETALLWRQQQ